ncbi:MAG: DUF1887 family protein [Clostridia bacterium]|nr:DUF1887 family protein [Clostridia bacterium]
MTIVEFFDDEAIDNAMGTMLLRPERTVFLYTGDKNLAFFNSLAKILKKRNIECELIGAKIDLSSIESAKAKIEEIIKKYPDCDFDIAGGSDEMLVAIGLTAKEYSLPLHSVNVRKQTVVSVNSQRTYSVQPVSLTVDELIQLHGGSSGKENTIKETYTWERDIESEKDIEKVWNICRQDPGAWNAAIGTLSGYRTDKKSVLTMIWAKLKKDGLVRKDNLGVRYKNEVVRYLLGKQGTALEMFTYIAAKESGFFDDGQSGIIIDWKGKREVENEIDVLLTHGAEGYFISCKNGMVDSDELYKLSTVAKRFGGKYAKKILVISKFEPDRSFMERAAEMDIKVIKNVRYLKRADFAKRLIG